MRELADRPDPRKKLPTPHAPRRTVHVRPSKAKKKGEQGDSVLTSVFRDGTHDNEARALRTRTHDNEARALRTRTHDNEARPLRTRTLSLEHKVTAQRRKEERMGFGIDRKSVV
jgi:hypothetical protein